MERDELVTPSRQAKQADRKDATPGLALALAITVLAWYLVAYALETLLR
jgi:hypothetical protein